MPSQTLLFNPQIQVLLNVHNLHSLITDVHAELRLQIWPSVHRGSCHSIRKGAVSAELPLDALRHSDSCRDTRSRHNNTPTGLRNPKFYRSETSVPNPSRIRTSPKSLSPIQLRIIGIRTVYTYARGIYKIPEFAASMMNAAHTSHNPSLSKKKKKKERKQ